MTAYFGIVRQTIQDLVPKGQLLFVEGLCVSTDTEL